MRWRLLLLILIALVVGIVEKMDMPSILPSAAEEEKESDAELFRGIRDVAELEVSEFKFHKYVWMKHNQKLVSYGDNDLIKLESDIILPVNMVFVGKIDMSGASFEKDDDGRYHILLPYPYLRRVVNDPDYKAMEKLSRQQWFRGPRISDKVLTQLTASATDSVFADQRNVDRMLEMTRDNAARALIPLVAKAKRIAMDRVVVDFREGQTLDSLKVFDLENRQIKIRQE